MQPVTSSNVDFTVQRIKRTVMFLVNAPGDIAFPLFGPVKEKAWAAGWSPEILYSVTSDVEEHMVFRTASKFDEHEWYKWVISRYQPDIFLIEYTVSTEERIWFITVKCQPSIKDTNVSVTYDYLGLTPEGHRRNEIAIKEMYAHNLADWQEAINYYLQTGKQKQ